MIATAWRKLLRRAEREPFTLANMRSALEAAQDRCREEAAQRTSPRSAALFEGRADAYADCLRMLDLLDDTPEED